MLKVLPFLRCILSSLLPLFSGACSTCICLYKYIYMYILYVYIVLVVLIFHSFVPFVLLCGVMSYLLIAIVGGYKYSKLVN